MMKSALLWLLLIPLLSLIWWFWADRRLRKHPPSRIKQLLLAFGLLVFFVGYGWVVLGRDGLVTTSPPPLLMAIVLLWGLIFLPFVAMPMLSSFSLLALIRKFTNRHDTGGIPSSSWSRRKWLGSVLTALPLLGTYGTAMVGMRQITHFRIRDVTLKLADLPPELEGLRIAHVTDIHVGKFTRGEVLQEIVKATNALDADLVLFTGDLIDYSIRDLPAAVRMMQGMRARSGVYLVEGNHDLLDDAEAFEKGVREGGLNLLRNQVAHLQIRGVGVDLLGAVWNYGVPQMANDVAGLSSLIRPGAFPILLAHHPYAFDSAVTHRIPLTLAGHTHGGQLMLTEDVGVGSVMFRYWSGLYERSGCALWISNGVGNWFPIRVNAPAEIVHLTLRRA